MALSGTILGRLKRGRLERIRGHVIHIACTVSYGDEIKSWYIRTRRPFSKKF